MNNRFLVIATLSGGDFDGNDVWTNQWSVGTFEQLGTCYVESQIDLEKTLTDGFEWKFEDEETSRTGSCSVHGICPLCMRRSRASGRDFRCRRQRSCRSLF